MTFLQHWTRLPNFWIEDGGLKAFRWVKGEGSDNLAALMALTVICNHADQTTGVARLTYNQLCTAANLSRAKLSAGLSILEARHILSQETKGRSAYALTHFDDKSPWAMFPAKGLYLNGGIAAFSEFKLRLPVELDALKLYFLFASRRDRMTNVANISYEKIEEFSGVGKNHIRRALSVLAANHLVHIEHRPSNLSELGTANAYRLAHLNTRQHFGTTGRGQLNL